MNQTNIPQGLATPNALTLNIVTAGNQPPAPGPLSAGVATIGPLDLTTVTGVSLLVRKPDGSTVTWAATFTPASSQAVSGATNATPGVVTVPNTAPLGATVTIAGVGGNAAANGKFYPQVLTSTTFALHQDATSHYPVAGTGNYTSGGTVTPNATGTVTHAFSATSAQAPLGDLDQIGVYAVVAELQVAGGGVVPCQPALLNVVSDFAPAA